MITEILTEAIQKALAEFGFHQAVVELDHPQAEEFGDWSTNAALQYGKTAEKFASPKAFADALKDKLKELLAGNVVVSDITVAGPGFINFSLNESYWFDRLELLAGFKDLASLLPQTGAGKTVIVEYSSPNIAKPFTIGHLRSTIIGDALANLYQALGWQVKRDNHVGDWGTQFGKLIYAIKTWGNQTAISQSERPIKELVNLYVKFHQEAEKNPGLDDYGREWFKKLENGDPEARELWQWCIDLSWQEFNRIYQELKIKFTENNGRGYGESFFEQRMDQIVAFLEEKLPQDQMDQNGGAYAEGEDGAKLVFFKNDALPSLMILKKDGATLYSTRDLATDYFRLQEFKPDLIINEVGAEQSLYFKQIYQIEQMLGWFKPGQRVHVKHGLYRFKDKKMSTRKGDVIWLEDVIAEAKERAMALSKSHEVGAGQVAIGSLKWNDLKSEAARDIVFDWEEILSMKGNSGPYVQYAAVRAQSVLDKLTETTGELNRAYHMQPAELALIRQLDRFTEAVVKAATEFAPHHLAAFLFELAQRFNAFYNQLPILNAEADSRAIRLRLTAATKQVLTTGLSLLGIETPEEM